MMNTMHLLLSDMRQTSHPRNVCLTKIAWTTANMMCAEYGLTVVETFASLVRSEANTKLDFTLGNYIERRLDVDEEDVWRFDMKAAEEVVNVFAQYVERDKQLQLLASLMPPVEHCIEIHRMLKG